MQLQAWQQLSLVKCGTESFLTWPFPQTGGGLTTWPRPPPIFLGEHLARNFMSSLHTPWALIYRFYDALLSQDIAWVWLAGKCRLERLRATTWISDAPAWRALLFPSSASLLFCLLQEWEKEGVFLSVILAFFCESYPARMAPLPLDQGGAMPRLGAVFLLEYLFPCLNRIRYMGMVSEGAAGRKVAATFRTASIPSASHPQISKPRSRVSSRLLWLSSL